jgi:hypothetical protein
MQSGSSQQDCSQSGCLAYLGACYLVVFVMSMTEEVQEGEIVAWQAE